MKNNKFTLSIVGVIAAITLAGCGTSPVSKSPEPTTTPVATMAATAESTPESTPESTDCIGSPYGCDTSEELSTDEPTSFAPISLKEDYDVDLTVMDASVLDVKNAIDNKETFVLYAGFKTCPWCVEAVPVLKGAIDSTNTEVPVYYINTRKMGTEKSNIDIKDYDEFVNMFGDYLKEDENNIKHLYTPFFVFIKDGEIAAVHQGTIEGHDAHERKMTDDEVAELTSMFIDDLTKIK